MFGKIYKGKRVLVTGDTGFKGSWLCIWLRELGAEVYGYALPAKNACDNYMVSGLGDMISHMEGDIRDYQKLEKYFKEVQPEIVFHLAAQSLVRESYRSPRDTFETNVMGTVNFYECLRKVKTVKAAINVTSDKCYRQMEQTSGYKEEDSLGGRDPYSASKASCEMVAQAYLKSFFENSSCLVASVRAGNVLGGGDWAQDRIIPDLFRAIGQERPLSIRCPDAVRPWQHVLEPLSGYLILAEGLYQGKRSLSGAWNLGPLIEGDRTVRQLVEQVIKTLGKGKYVIDEHSTHPYEASYLRLSIDKALTHLDWKPRLRFQEMVEFTVEGYEAKDIYKSRVSQIQRYTRRMKED
ncbi:MAG: CDP-glucose 4,6-dehydratase [Candidatus Omnitrophica bacterium]|nr:CDP-glucose 4,6-dehydratase [Candidatus Omnitrophota bacterium]MDE2223226.1 CDP-glucose 4,6-dehydratase [Candidatus Omnitrophota bacterium]